MKKYVMTFVCIMLAMQLGACSAKSMKVEGFSSPESVTTDGTYFYVSNVGKELKPMDKDGDGYISRLSAKGKVLDAQFISGLNAPKGMTVNEGILYVADIDKVKGFSVSNGKQVFDLDFSAQGTSFLNDMTVVDENTLLVSSTDIGAVYEISLNPVPSLRKIDSNVDLVAANGIYFDRQSGTLYVATYGSNNQSNGFIGKGKLENGKLDFQKIYNVGGLYDGIAVNDGKVYFSDWVTYEKKGVLKEFDLASGKTVTLDLPEKIGGPADFYLDKDNKKLWIPMMMENSLLIIPY